MYSELRRGGKLVPTCNMLRPLGQAKPRALINDRQGQIEGANFEALSSQLALLPCRKLQATALQDDTGDQTTPSLLLDCVLHGVAAWTFLQSVLRHAAGSHSIVS